MRCQVCHLAGQETYPKPLTSKRQVVLSKKDHTLGMDDSFRNLEPSPSTFLYHMRAKFPIRIPSKAFSLEIKSAGSFVLLRAYHAHAV